MKTRALVPARSRGFTLIELMIAMAMMLFGLLALWSLHTAAIQANANAWRMSVCTTLAQDMLEKVGAETWIANYNNPDIDPSTMGAFPLNSVDGLEDLPGYFDGSGVLVNSMGNTDATLGPLIYNRTYHIEWANAGQTDRVLVRVRVTYIDAAGNRHGVTIGMTRLVDRYDPMSLGGLN
jgi:prepilin-type N-terminal cleavage/methylation domain-containing protein